MGFLQKAQRIVDAANDKANNYKDARPLTGKEKEEIEALLDKAKKSSK